MRASRRGSLPPWVLGGLIVGTGLAMGAGAAAAALRGGHPPLLGAGAGVGIAALGLLGLPSVDVRVVAHVLTVVSAALVVRYAELGGSLLGGSQVVVAWTVGTVGALVFADRLGSRDAQAPTAATPPTERAGGWAPAARTVVAVTAVLLVLMVIVAPSAMGRLGRASEPGDGPRLDRSGEGPAPIRATASVDMTERPQLTDEVVLTVESPEPSFWRGQTFDRWDGRRWTQSDLELTPVLPDRGVQTAPDDLAASTGGEVRQRVRVVAPYADLFFAQATPARIEAPGPVFQLGDGTLTTGTEPMGRGTTYTVVSRRVPLTEARLRALDGPVPASVTERYAQEPVSTARVRAAARAATAGAATTYDRIVALERWMGGRTEYSLDAPLPPRGVDVVDHFLFTSRQGWCQQVASSLVVMARSLGIPARLATGYVPEDRDAITGTWVVRERDAHAWTEVWFPEVGWVAFDPTADVPLAGTDGGRSTVRDWLLDHLLVILIGIAAVILIAGPVARIARQRVRARRARPAPCWATTAEARLDALGRTVERARGPSETSAAYATTLAELLDDPDLAEVGRVVDEARWAPTEPPAHRRDAADAVLARPR